MIQKKTKMDVMYLVLAFVMVFIVWAENSMGFFKSVKRIPKQNFWLGRLHHTIVILNWNSMAMFCLVLRLHLSVRRLYYVPTTASIMIFAYSKCCYSIIVLHSLLNCMCVCVCVFQIYIHTLYQLNINATCQCTCMYISYTG